VCHNAQAQEVELQVAEQRQALDAARADVARVAGELEGCTQRLTEAGKKRQQMEEEARLVEVQLESAKQVC
jgi:hypothetical protein